MSKKLYIYYKDKCTNKKFFNILQELEYIIRIKVYYKNESRSTKKLYILYE